MLLLIPQRYEFSSKSQQKSSISFTNVGCCWYHKGTNFQANHNLLFCMEIVIRVVADTTKVRIFKQITTTRNLFKVEEVLLLIPQRYEFSSKSQQENKDSLYTLGCCWYHKGTNFQANHNCVLSISHHRQRCCWYHKGTNFQANHNRWRALNSWYSLLLIPQRYEFSSKSQLNRSLGIFSTSCCWYHKGTNFQANHNDNSSISFLTGVVADTTKVRIFKQITTTHHGSYYPFSLLLIPQRYEFSSKSQHYGRQKELMRVVADTTKVRIFKQITTRGNRTYRQRLLLLIPQRYEFSSKSQPSPDDLSIYFCCCWYHKGTNFQANHNTFWSVYIYR